jgi:hypothetical protein
MKRSRQGIDAPLTDLRFYFFAAASSLRNAAMVSAEESLRLLFFGRRLVLLE